MGTNTDEMEQGLSEKNLMTEAVLFVCLFIYLLKMFVPLQKKKTTKTKPGLPVCDPGFPWHT